jgi:Flp pilus assembly protein TadD
LAHCHRAIELDPNEAGIYVNLGAVLAEMGRVDDALAGFRQALRILDRWGQL